MIPCYRGRGYPCRRAVLHLWCGARCHVSLPRCGCASLKWRRVQAGGVAVAEMVGRQRGRAVLPLPGPLQPQLSCAGYALGCPAPFYADFLRCRSPVLCRVAPSAYSISWMQGIWVPKPTTRSPHMSRSSQGSLHRAPAATSTHRTWSSTTTDRLRFAAACVHAWRELRLFVVLHGWRTTLSTLPL